MSAEQQAAAAAAAPASTENGNTAAAATTTAAPASEAQNATTTNESTPDTTTTASGAAAAAGESSESSPAAAAAAQQQPISLYVGELDPGVTEAMLYEIFSMIGPVASIRVCRDAVTRRSLGYAYVNYMNASDGERALRELNYSVIKNRPCRIMWSQRDPSLRKTGAGNIFIKNLDANIDNKALHDTFAAFGKILSCKVAIDEQGRSKGYGFIHYEAAESADKAINAVNGMLLNDKIVYVGHHIPRRERQAKIDEIRSRFTNLYVKNLPSEVSENEVSELFGKHGKITSLALARTDEGSCKGFGFINFENHEEARAAVDNLHEIEYKGNTLYVARAQKKAEREEELRRQYDQAKYEQQLKYQGVNLYVKNLEDDIDDEKLNQEFAPYGTITSCKVMRDEDKGASKGFGFVCFSAPDEATKALTEMNGKMLGSKPLYVSLAQRKEARRQQLETQAAQRNQYRSQQIPAPGMPQVPGFMPPGGPQVYGYPGAFPAQGRGGMMGYPQGVMPGGGRPRYGPPNGMPGMPPVPSYPQYPPGAFPPNAGGGRGNASGGPGGPNSRGGMPPSSVPPTGSAGGAPAPAGGNYGQVPPRPNQGGPGGPGGRRGGNRPADSQSGLNAQALANASPQDQKQMLGEAIYPKVHKTHAELAGKITGMLLEMDNAELLHLVEDDEALRRKIEEALAVLEESKPAAPAANASA